MLTRPATGDDGAHITYCRLCEAQCGLVVEVKDGVIAKVGPDREHPVSEGHLCVKGPGMVSIVYDPDRVVTPLRRTGAPGVFEPVSWEEAMTDITARLRKVLDRDGASAVGVYAGNPSSFATLHYAYAGLFGKALGADKVFNALHVDTGSKNVAMELVFGNPLAWTFPDLEDCEFLMILGANPMVSHMSIISEPRALHKLQAIHQRGGVVVVDPRRTETARRFEHVQVRPDSDVWLLAAMLNHIFEAGLERRDLLVDRTTGWADLRAAVSPITAERAERHCGVEATTIRALAERLANARTAAVYGRVGTNRGRFSTLTNILIESLNVVTGRFGAEGGWVSGVSPLYSDPDAPSPYPAYGATRSRIGDLPMILGYTPGGTLASEITTAGEGQMTALFVDCGNPVNSYPRGDLTEAALEELDLMVSIDLYVTETSRHAHYILPATTFYEREDFTELWVTNAPRPWVQYTPAVVHPQGEARLEYDIYDELLERLGLPSMFAALHQEDAPRPGLMEATDTLFRQGPYGDSFGARPDGLSLARLREEYPHGARVTERVDAEGSWSRVTTEDGRVRLWHEVTRDEFSRLMAEATTNDNDTLYLFGRRKLASLNSWMHNVEGLVRSDRPTLQMHPDDARERQIGDRTVARISSKAGTLEVEVEVTGDVVRGSVNYPHGWGHKGGWRFANQRAGENINLLASADPEDWEQVSGMTHLDGIAVTVLPA